jgi:hypothetical protein
MAPGGSGGATIEENVFTYVYIENRTREVLIYMETYRHTID